ncbi:Leucine-rich_repeat domain superfamily [Hexamita inflata]|uniref:Leucine-rich_repeat domain superfamily n=1 Tax=Hexamita inflata TaxID=28002 RepID=A0ABP1J4K9_9EUKA
MFKMQQLPTLQQLKQREDELLKQYQKIDAEIVISDIIRDISLSDVQLINHVNQEQKLSSIAQNRFYVDEFKIYSLKIAEHFHNIDQNTMLIMRDCRDLHFEEVPTNIYNLTIEDCNPESLEGIQNMKQLIYLSLTNNFELNDMTPVNQLKNLKILSLKNNSIKDNKYCGVRANFDFNKCLCNNCA